MASHWADQTANRIIAQKGEKAAYTCAAGITPSGTVHIGNFREIITVDLVVRALRDRGKSVRFIYSWDDYDVFRKVPGNMPDPEQLETYLRMPIVDTPDTCGEAASYAAHHERAMESTLPRVGIQPEFIYQHEKYQASVYADAIKQALVHADSIREILNRHRREPLPDGWLPISIFCTHCKRDTTRVNQFDGDYGLHYHCDSCGQDETIDLRRSGCAKLPWRVDWPMRWSYEAVDFEPGGKDHSSEGGSYTTAQEIAQTVYGIDAPVYMMYDFVRIKGKGGKISSSSGDVVTLDDVLEIYEPAMVRWLFASPRANSEFAISFDLDVLKNYEDFDRCERVYYGQEKLNEKKTAVQKRIYELSQPGTPGKESTYQPPFRHLCNILQINDLDVEETKTFYRDQLKTDADRERFETRAACAVNWIKKYAPDDFRFLLNKVKIDTSLGEQERTALKELISLLDRTPAETEEKTVFDQIYTIIRETGIENKTFFQLLYRLLINKDRGPKLAGFILAIGPSRVKKILEQYV